MSSICVFFFVIQIHLVWQLTLTNVCMYVCMYLLQTIQLIQQKSGCKVQIDQQVPEGHPCKINMSGNTQAIQNAIQIVQEIMTNGVSRVQVCMYVCMCVCVCVCVCVQGYYLSMLHIFVCTHV